MSDDFPAFRNVPRTGVIYVTTEATQRGFSPRNPDWCNLGQGQPETGELPGAPKRVQQIAIDVDDQEYAPVAGMWELREQIASLYNPAVMAFVSRAMGQRCRGGQWAPASRASGSTKWANQGPACPAEKWHGIVRQGLCAGGAGDRKQEP